MIILASTRPGRAGAPIAEWVRERVEKAGQFEVDFVDLLELNLPMLDEPNHPLLRQYTKAHTKAWSARVDAADAFIIVTPEYNYSMPGSLKNAVDFLSHEWNFKPVGFVSYGGVAAGARSVQMAKQVVTSLKMMPLVEAVQIPFVRNHIVDGRFQPTESFESSLGVLTRELGRWASAMAPLRPVQQPEIKIQEVPAA